MRTDLSKINGFRVRKGTFASDDSDGPNGAFFFHHSTRLILRTIASNGDGWEHVSLSAIYVNSNNKHIERTPTWEEMCWIKNKFWEPEETVMQLHPPESEWINNHEHCLHLWRPLNAEIPRPPGIMVGIKGVAAT